MERKCLQGSFPVLGLVVHPLQGLSETYLGYSVYNHGYCKHAHVLFFFFF